MSDEWAVQCWRQQWRRSSEADQVEHYRFS